MEIRFKSLEAECRDDGVYKIGGYVNVTERESELLYSGKRGKWFNEVVKQGAFTRSLNSGKDIPLLLEHDYDKKLADTSTSLTLKEDQIGLRFDAEIRDKDVYEKVKSKQINNCSFGFLPVEQEFEPVSEVREKRYLKDLDLLEISLVENPAYAGSLVEVRNLNDKEEELRKKSEKADENKEEVEADKKEDSKEDKNKETEESNKQEKTEDKPEEKSEDVKSEDDLKQEKTEDKSDEKRGFVEEQIEKVNNIENSNSEEIIKEIIDEKEKELENAELMESWAKEELEFVKEINKDQENYLESDLARRNLDVLKLRVQILKLKSI